MKKMILIVFCSFVLIGCQKNETMKNNTTNEDEFVENKLKYEEMKNKLIEYGKLLYENEQWLNNESEEVVTYINLKDMSERNNYDISMFVDPITGNKCDELRTMIEFVIKDVSNKNNIIYEFNPILYCGDDDYLYDETHEQYEEMKNILVNYMRDLYKNNKFINENFYNNVYKVNLYEFEQMGYDISKFVNNETENQCDFHNTYGLFQRYDDDKYVFGAIVDCD